MSDPNQPPRPDGESPYGSSGGSWPPPSRPPGQGDDTGQWSTPPGASSPPPAGSRPEPQYGQYAGGDPYPEGGQQGYAPYQGQYQGGYGQPYGAPPQYQQRPGSGLAIASLILGILSVIGFCIPVLAPLLGLIAVVLGFVALSRIRAGRAAGRGMAIGGLVTGVLGLILGVSILGALVPVFNSQVFNEVRDCAQQPNQEAIQRCVEEALRSGQIGN